MKKKSQIVYLCVAIVAGSLGCPSTTMSQSLPKFRLPIMIVDSESVVRSVTLYYGIHDSATRCLDAATTLRGFSDHWDVADSQVVTESENPPPPFGFYCYFSYQLAPNPSCFPSTGITPNIRASASRTQIDTFQISITPNDNNTVMKFVWAAPSILSQYCDSSFLTGFDPLVGSNIRINMLTNSLYRTTHDPDFNLIQKIKIIMYGPKPNPPLPPGIVGSPSPANGATNQPLNVALSWDPGSSAFFYKVQVSTDSTFQDTTKVVVTSPSYSPAGLKQFTTYYWRVVIYNPNGASFFQQPPFRFTTLLLPPNPPTLLAPTASQQNVPVTTTLRWNKVPIAPATYQVQLAKDTGFSVIVKDTSSVADTSVQIGPLENCVTYYWKVRGTNTGGTGNYTAVRNFRVTLATPAAPVLVTPNDNATDLPLTDTLKWSGDVCSDNYRLQVADNVAFTNPKVAIQTASTSRRIDSLAQGTVYFWKVNAFNTKDSSAYTARKFTTLLSSPTAFLPADGDSNQPQTLTITWRKNPFADTYRYEVSEDQLFTSILFSDSLVVDTSAQVGPLNFCHTYFWRVKARNANAVSAYSTPRKFKIQTGLPLFPALTFPADGQTNVDESPTVTWTPGAGDLCAKTYVVQYSLDSLFGSIIGSDTVSTTSRRIGPLNPLTMYFWRVAAVSGAGQGPFAKRSFTVTNATSPAQPTLSSPPDGAGDVPTRPTLMWDTTRRATSYRLQVARDSAFTVLINNDSTLVVPSKQIGPLQNSTLYFWRVNAKNAVGTSPYSSVRRFVTLFPPASPFLLNPTNGATDVPTAPEFDWSIGERADAYEIQVAKDTVFSAVVFSDTTVTVLSWRLPFALESITKYYWRVRGKNTVGWGSWSSIYTFRTTRTGVGNWVIPLTVAETGPARDVIYFGVNPYATSGIDPGLGEFELPPVQAGFFDARWVSPLIGEGLRLCVVRFHSYTQVDTFEVQFQPGVGTYPMKFSWPRSYVQSVCDSIVIVDQLVNASIRVRMDVDSTLTVSNAPTRSLYLIKYGAYGVLDVKPIPPEIPKGFVLYQNYPNPFNPTTHIQFSTDRSAELRIAIYDVLGREVATVANGTFFPGQYSLEWNGQSGQGASLPSGVYYVRMIAVALSDEGAQDKRFTITRKMLMMK
ncbi:MAG: T9SS type A sorting domain-containing protein [Ignavibacteria bacterium]|nr:T9SS type A sorting domain-containing protein [Ignavibacteria bacterium]